MENKIKELYEYHKRASAELQMPNCDGTFNHDELIYRAIQEHDIEAKALKKQITTPISISTEPISKLSYALLGIYYKCPNCKVDLEQTVKSDYECKYCPECGQKVRWK